MNQKNIVLGLGAVVVLTLLVGASFLYKKPAKVVTAEINSFEECAKVYPVMESYPPQCATVDGKSFTQDIGNELSKLDLITIDTPRPNTSVSSPLLIEGTARGTWFFEASFPVELQDENGTVLAQGPAQAQGDWMTEDFVPYKLTLNFPKQVSGSKGKLILKKDNPSGEPSRDDSLIVPIVFK